MNYSDPFGLCPDPNKPWCSSPLYSLLRLVGVSDATADKWGSIGYGAAMIAGAPGSGMAVRSVAGAAAAGAVRSEVGATDHGAMRMADPSRLGAEGVRDAIANATRTFTQKDGAQVFAQEIGGRFNVVVQGDRGVVTTFKNLSEKSLERLGKNYGWKPR